MHAVRLHELGPPENLRYEEVADPVAGPGQVRIRVGAAGVHVVDTAIRAGRNLGTFPHPELPAIPGREVAGVVDAVGPGVEEDWVGRRVVTHLGMASGGYAELAVRDVAALHVIPDGMGDDVAVATIGTGRTAVAILETARLVADDVVLVTAAAGGLGSLFVQAAGLAKATVVGAAGGEAKTEVVRSLGADIAVDYSREDWPDTVDRELAGRDVTVVLDGVGGAIGRAALELLGSGGRQLMFGFSSGEPTPMSAGDILARGLTVAAAPAPRLLRGPGGMRRLEERALAAVTRGELRPVVGPPFSLVDAAAAHRAIEMRATIGKTVLVP